MGSIFADENRGHNENNYEFYGSTQDAYDIRYADDCHQTFGLQYPNNSNTKEEIK